MDPDKSPSMAEAFLKHAREKAEIGEIFSKHSEQAEHELLMPLWKHLGDHTENYHKAFICAQAFREIDDAIYKTLERVPDSELRCVLMEVLAKLLTGRAACFRAVEAKKQEFAHSKS